MVMEAANTTVTVLRGTQTDQYGDVIDSNQPVFEGVPAILIETSRTTTDPANPVPRTIRIIQCQVAAWIGLLNTDRILDESTQQIYMITEVTKPPTLMGAPVDTVAVLKRVTATTT